VTAHAAGQRPGPLADRAKGAGRGYWLVPRQETLARSRAAATRLGRQGLRGERGAGNPGLARQVDSARLRRQRSGRGTRKPSVSRPAAAARLPAEVRRRRRTPPLPASRNPRGSATAPRGHRTAVPARAARRPSPGDRGQGAGSRPGRPHRRIPASANSRPVSGRNVRRQPSGSGRAWIGCRTEVSRRCRRVPGGGRSGRPAAESAGRRSGWRSGQVPDGDPGAGRRAARRVPEGARAAARRRSAGVGRWGRPGVRVSRRRPAYRPTGRAPKTGLDSPGMPGHAR
jgi:hypothetical protein